MNPRADLHKYATLLDHATVMSLKANPVVLYEDEASFFYDVLEQTAEAVSGLDPHWLVR